MTIRPLAGFVVLACSFALTHLSAADPAGEIPPGVPESLTRPRSDRGHPLPEGEGGKSSTQSPRALVNGDIWQTSINQQLDESIARLQTADVKDGSGVVVITRGGGSGDSSRPSIAATAVGPENEHQAARIAQLLQEHGLPPGLTSVVAVESAFDPLALSPKGARGLWQLMPATARRYGLRVEPDVDERIDALKSTRAAGAYIKDLFVQFGDWPLVLAAYNTGEDRVARAMARTGARDFWTLRRRGALPEETLSYVPAVLEKLEAPLEAPDPFRIPSAASPTESPAGRVTYATPDTHQD